MKQTTVEWFMEGLESFGNKHELTVSWATVDELAEQAKEMESLEKIDNFNDGWNHCEKYFKQKKLYDHIVDINEMVSPQTELSDNVLFEQATVAMEEMYGYGCETEIDAYFRGLKWMQKQFNK